MKFKVLRNKQHSDIFGEIYYCDQFGYKVINSKIPWIVNIQGIQTMEQLKQRWDLDFERVLINQLDNYELVEVELKFV